MSTAYPLLPFSQIVHADVLAGRSQAWLFHYRLTAQGLDPQQLELAMQRVLAHHPVLAMDIHPDGTHQHRPGYRTPYFSYTLSHQGDRVTLDVHCHRILGDAASLGVFLHNLDLAYRGQELPADTYLDYLSQQQAQRQSPQYEETALALAREYDGIDAPTCPTPDAPPATTPYTTGGTLSVPYTGTMTQLYVAVAQAIMEYNGTDRAALTWGYVGRQTASEQAIFGSLHRDIPMLLSRDRAPHRALLMAQARRQVEQGIVHSLYPYTYHATDRARWQYAVCVQMVPPVPLAIGPTIWQLCPVQDEPQPCHAYLDVEYDAQQGMLTLHYSQAHYRAQSIQRFAELILQHAQPLPQPVLPPFIPHIARLVEQHPQRTILGDQETTLTYSQLWELSGRVYAYLQQQGIGREDFVMVHLPRSVRCYAAMLGIWRAGAAMVLFEDDALPQRVQYAHDDCRCRLTLDMQVWDQVMAMPPLDGYRETDPHDACFAIYTSGSEGHPKGILHEYGKLPLIIQSLVIDGENLLQENDRLGLPLPMSAGASLVLMVDGLAQNTYVDVFPLRYFADADILTQHINERQLSATGIVPSMIMSHRVQASCLRKVITGTEMSHRVYVPEYAILNTYGQSESLITPLTFRIDRLYDNTPAGRPTGQYGLVLLDDDDRLVPHGESGEVCYPTPYTRGYINMPQQTAATFRDGLYHTGDIARVNEEGNYVILGRKTDMIKINGNRIEPAEIETAVRRLLRLDWAMARGFVCPDRSFIAVYYTADIQIDLAATRQALMQQLPSYMVPSYFVRIPQVPHLPNGKVDRQALPMPQVQDYIAPYAAPATPLQQHLCDTMARVLSLPRVGLDDDFYLLGGDSLRTIRLVTLLAHPRLTVTDIYLGRTPRAISIWVQEDSPEDRG